MPKPTTHTDIVVVTKQDPSGSARVNESVQIMLVAAKDGLADIVVAERTIETPPPPALPGGIESKLIALSMGSLVLGYTASVTFGSQSPQRRISAEVNNEPWGWGDTLSPASASNGQYDWTNPANDALIAKLDLVVKGEVNGQALTCAGTKRTENGLRRLTVHLELNGERHGTLELTASMDAS